MTSFFYNLFHPSASQTPAQPQAVVPSQMPAAPQNTSPSFFNQLFPGGVLGDDANPQQRSVRQWLGGLADAAANIGGSAPSFAPLEAAHLQNLAFHNQQLQEQQKNSLSQNQFQHQRLGAAVQGLKALVDNNPNLDISKAWNFLSRQVGLSDDQASQIGAQLSQNPSLISGLSAATGKAPQYGLNPIYGKDANGNPVVYQLDSGGGQRRVDLGQGVSATEPTQVVNTGDRDLVVGKFTGTPQSQFAVHERPGEYANREEKIREADQNNSLGQARLKLMQEANQSKIDMQRERQANIAADAQAKRDSAVSALNDAFTSARELHERGALPGESSNLADEALSAVSRVPLVNRTLAALGNETAQKRALLDKQTAVVLKNVVNTLPAGASRTAYFQKQENRGLPDPNTLSYPLYIKALEEQYNSIPNIDKTKNPFTRELTRANNSRNSIGQPSVTNW